MAVEEIPEPFDHVLGDVLTELLSHHDLQSAADYFDWFVLLNTRLVGSGPKEDIFNQDLLQETYGGKLTLLSKVGDLLKQKAFPVREKN